jgi:hypothetical protein
VAGIDLRAGHLWCARAVSLRGPGRASYPGLPAHLFRGRASLADGGVSVTSDYLPRLNHRQVNEMSCSPGCPGCAREFTSGTQAQTRSSALHGGRVLCRESPKHASGVASRPMDRRSATRAVELSPRGPPRHGRSPGPGARLCPSELVMYKNHDTGAPTVRAEGRDVHLGRSRD